MADKILDVRHVMDEMVSPEGLQAGGGGGEIPLPYNLNPSSSGFLNILNPTTASWCILNYYDDGSIVGELTLNIALEVTSDITSSLVDSYGYISLIALAPTFPAAEISGMHFCINGTNGENYLGIFDTHYVSLKYTEDIPAGTILIIDTTTILHTQS